MKAEAQGLVANYAARFDDLNRRADAIMQRGNAIGVSSPDAANASRMFAMAKAKLEALRAETQNAQREIADIKDKADMQRYRDHSASELEEGYVSINADFDAVESWITLAEANPQVARREPPAVPPPTDTPPAPQQ